MMMAPTKLQLAAFAVAYACAAADARFTIGFSEQSALQHSGRDLMGLSAWLAYYTKSPGGNMKPPGGDFAEEPVDEEPMNEEPLMSAKKQETTPPVDTTPTPPVDMAPLPMEEEQADSTPDSAGGEGCTADALELIRLLNKYRAENGLPSIPASSSLCTVGAAHAAESNTMSDPTGNAQCNMHSWKDCCYTDDHANMACMQDKPAELTCYTSKGFENSAWGSAGMNPEQAMSGWKNSKGHNDVMINLGTWANMEWKAVGAGIAGEYAHLWFGAEADDCASGGAGGSGVHSDLEHLAIGIARQSLVLSTASMQICNLN